MGKILHCMRYVVAPNQSVPVVTPKIVTVNTCISSLNISWGGLALRTSDLMETFMLLFFPLGFCYYKQSSKEHPYIFSLVHVSEQVFSERYIPKSLQLRCPHRLSGVGSVTSLQDSSLSSTFSASQGTPSPGSELILIHWENAEAWPPLHLRKDSPPLDQLLLLVLLF